MEGEVRSLTPPLILFATAFVLAILLSFLNEITHQAFDSRDSIGKMKVKMFNKIHKKLIVPECEGLT